MNITKEKILTTLAASAASFALIGCGSSSSSAEYDDESSSSVEESSSSQESSSSEETVSYSNSVVVHFSTDYTSSMLTYGNVSDNSFEDAGIDLGSDAFLFANGKYVYALSPSNVTLIDASKLSEGSGAIVKQASIGNSAYPYEIAFTDAETGWIVLNGRSTILKVNATSLAILDSIDVSAFAAEGATTASGVSIKVVDGKLAVLFGRLNNYVPNKPALLALYDAESGELQDTICLKGYNPASMKTNNGKLVVLTQGAYDADYKLPGDETRGIEIVDLKKKTSEFVMTGKDLGAGSTKLALDTIHNIAYVNIYNSYGNAPIAAVDLTKKSTAKSTEIADAEGGFVFDAVSGKLYVGDHAYDAAALYAYNGTDFNKVVEPEGVFPSYSIAVANW